MNGKRYSWQVGSFVCCLFSGVGFGGGVIRFFLTPLFPYWFILSRVLQNCLLLMKNDFLLRLKKLNIHWRYHFIWLHPFSFLFFSLWFSWLFVFLWKYLASKLFCVPGCRQRKSGETASCVTCSLWHHLILSLCLYILLTIVVSNCQTVKELILKKKLIPKTGQ